ncbi:MAG: sulfite exporter TauE/SafE family protein [Gammaproteobacteria bacterium]|jgi:uncharacterized membrane protein YfcA
MQDIGPIGIALDWTFTNFALATLIVAIGALLQAASGLGAGLIIVPLLTAVLSTELVPGPTIFGSLALSAVMSIGGRRQIDFTMTRSVLTGIVIGTIAAAWFIANVPANSLGLVFGVGVLVAVVVSLRVPRFSLNRSGTLAAGTFAGLLGTAAGIGAPVLALLYQHHPGPALRATLAYLYFVSSVVALVSLNFAGRFGAQEFVSGCYLAPGFVIGYFLSPRLAAFVDKGYARPLVFVVASASACFLIWRSLSQTLG